MMVQPNDLTRQHGATTTMQLEPEFAEETRIQDLEAEIGEAARNGTSTNSLKRERERIIESWIERVTKEIAEVGKDANKLGRLEDQLRRANEYKNLKFEHKSKSHRRTSLCH